MLDIFLKRKFGFTALISCRLNLYRGVECGKNGVPGVGSRSSANNDFIHNVLCDIASKPPREICPGPPTSSPSSSPTISPTPAPYFVQIIVSIYFDPWSVDTAWTLTDETGHIVYVDVPFGRYRSQDYVQQQVLLEAGKNYIFTIKDAADNGITGPDMAMYDVTLKDEGSEIRLVEGDGNFQRRRRHVFRIPYREEYPEQVVKPRIDFNPWLGELMVKIRVVLVFDDWHEETSWKITDANDSTNIRAEAPPGTYRFGDDITEEILLPPDRSYKFTIMDSYADGIDVRETDVYFVILEGSEYNRDPVELVKGNGSFGRQRSHVFRVPRLPFPTATPTDMPSPYPTPFETSNPTRNCLANHEFCIIPHECCSRRCVNHQCKLSGGSAEGGGRNSMGRYGGGTRGGAGAAERGGG